MAIAVQAQIEEGASRGEPDHLGEPRRVLGKERGILLPIERHWTHKSTLQTFLTPTV